MLKNENIICISSIDWDFIWQGHQEIMAAFARNGNRVLFIENTGIRMPGIKDIPRLKKRFVNWIKSAKGFREEQENLFIYSPLVLPFPYSRLARFINRNILLQPLQRWLKMMKFHNPIIWTFLPTGTVVDIINNINRKILVYYCIADFYRLADDSKKIKKTEDELIKKCDLIFVQGDLFKERCLRLNKNVYRFPFGVNFQTFENFDRKDARPPADMGDMKKPVIGYVGGVHKHIDFGLIKFIADRHPDWSIVMVGPLQTDVSGIKGRKNVFLLGERDFNELPAYIDRFDVCIIPYEINDYTKTVFPTKLNEYHAMGKPVVSTSLPEIVNFNKENGELISIGVDREDFNDKIERAVIDREERLVGSRIASAKKNSWTERIEEMSSLIQAAMDKKTESPANWREDFLHLYKVSRARAIKVLAVILGVYGLIFYTPLVWYAAEPLKISQPPQKADAIVVFAGGVGESGRAGQGYEERVQRAVDLYKKGYADHFIFSSGYTYLFKEPLVMKALAVSLGIPERSILLDVKAKNTLENVKFTRQILIDNGWKNILLVSSPYHMRRVSLVFAKTANDIKVTYVPIQNSHFYTHSFANPGEGWRQINIGQIRGILHEYLGIIYYWFEGYI